MIGPVSGTGRAMMASLQQAIQKGMPPDQAIQYVKSMATQGVAPLTDLYAMMNQFQRLKQQPVQAPQTPPTIRDQLNMAEQQQAQQQMAMQQGLGGLPAPAMEQAQFAGGGIVAFQDGGEVNPISYMQRLIREALARGDTETAEEIRASLEDYTSLGRNIPRLNIPTRSNLGVDLREERFRQQQGMAPVATAPSPAAPSPAAPSPAAPSPAAPSSAAPSGARGPLARREAPPAAPRTDTTSRGGIDSRVPAAPRVAAAAPAPAAPKMPSAADFEQQLQERNKPFAEATERFRTYLQGEEATSKEEAKRDRMLTLAQAGFAMAEAASKPGATFLGSVGAAGGDFAKSMMQLNREAAVAKRNMQKELLALDQAKAANDVNMYNASLSSFMKDREFVTQVNQFNQGFRLQQAKLELDRVLGTGQIAASMANAAATFGLRKEELEATRGYREDESAARRDAERNEMAVRTLELVDKRANALRFDRAFNALSPEEQQKILNALPAQAAREIAALSGGGGGTSNLLNEADKIAGIGGPG